MDKRSFLSSLPALCAGIIGTLKNIDYLNEKYTHLSALELAKNENYWSEIRR